MSSDTTATITIDTDGRMERGETLTPSQRDRIRDLYRTLCWTEHRETLCAVVDSLIERVRSGELSDADALMDAVPEACDGVLVYSQDCAEYLSASRNENAWEEAFAGDGKAPEDYVRAAMALEQDVREELDALGYGYDDEAWDAADDSGNCIHICRECGATITATGYCAAHPGAIVDSIPMPRD